MMWFKHAAAVIGSRPFLASYARTAVLKRGQQQQQPQPCCSYYRVHAAGTTALFTTTAKSLAVKYPPRPKPPPDEDITEVYLKGSGPGGQKINKTSSAVQLKHLPTGIVIKCQETRSRSQNRKLARQHLAEKIDDLLNGENSRSAVVARINARKKASALKKSRRKHGASAAGKDDGEGEIDREDDGVTQDEVPSDSSSQRSGHRDEPSL